MGNAAVTVALPCAAAAATAALPRGAGMATGDIRVTMTGEAAGPAATATPIPGVVETGAAMVGGLEWVEGTVVGLEVVTLHAVEVLRVAVMVVADAMVVADDTPLPAAEALLPAA